MLRFLSAAALALSLTPAAASAYVSAECGEIEDQGTTLLDVRFDIEISHGPTSRAQAMPNGCLAREVEIYDGRNGVAFTADEMRITGPRLMNWVRGEIVLPPDLTVTFAGIRLDEGRDLPADLVWLDGIAGSGRSVDARLAWRWSEADQRLVIEEATLDFAGDDRITVSLTGTAGGAWQPYDASWSDFGVETARVDIAFDTLFDRLVIAPLTAAGTDPTPEAVAFIAAGATGFIRSLPQRVVSMSSQDALASFLATLPDPQGRLQIAIDSPLPFSAGRVGRDLRSGLPLDAALPADAAITAAWDTRQR